MPIIQ